MQKVKDNVELKDDYVNKQHKALDVRHTAFTKRFDEYFENVTKDRKRIEKRMLGAESKLEELDYKQDKMDERVKDTCAKAIK